MGNSWGLLHFPCACRERPTLIIAQNCDKAVQAGENDLTERRYASAVYAVVVCLSVRLSVCPSQAGILSKG